MLSDSRLESAEELIRNADKVRVEGVTVGQARQPIMESIFDQTILHLDQPRYIGLNS